MKRTVEIEGYTPEEILDLPDEQIAQLLFCDESLVFHAGTAEILGEFHLADESLIIELAQIDGGGEGILPILWNLAERYGRKIQKQRMEWIGYAINCPKPNLKLKRVLEKKGFIIKEVKPGVKAYWLETVI